MNVDERLAALLARALDPAATEEEARTSAVALLRTAKKHGRRIAFLVDAPEPAPAPRAAPSRAAPRASSRRVPEVPEWLKVAGRAAGRAFADEIKGGALDDLFDEFARHATARATGRRKR